MNITSIPNRSPPVFIPDAISQPISQPDPHDASPHGVTQEQELPDQASPTLLSSTGIEANQSSVRKIVGDSLLAFSTQYPNLVSQATAKQFARSIFNHRELCSIELFSLWFVKCSVILKTGYLGYQASVLLWGEWCILCDRARGGYTVHRLNHSLIRPECIESIIQLQYGSEANYTEFFSHSFPNQYCQPKDAYCEWLERTTISEQKSGNGALANADGIVLPFLILSKVKSALKSNSHIQMTPKDLETIQSEESETFNLWKQFKLILKFKTLITKNLQV